MFCFYNLVILLKKMNILPLKTKSISIEVNCNNSLDLNKLSSLEVDFIAVTWIGNYNSQIPMEIPPIKLAKELLTRNQTVLLHIPARNLTKTAALNILNTIKNVGIRNILSLKGQSTYINEKNDVKVDFPYACHFVEFIKENFNDYFTVGVTGYPEKHPRSSDFEEDMKYLELKVSKGADFIVTQACFDVSACRKFLERCKEYSINIPIIAGFSLFNSLTQLNILKNICKISICEDVQLFVEQHQNNEELIRDCSKEKLLQVAAEILSEKSGYSGLHIFTMNNMELDVLLDDLKKFIK